MSRVFKGVLLTLVMLAAVGTTNTAKADHPYWRNYWNWYDGYYRPYYHSYYISPGASASYGPGPAPGPVVVSPPVRPFHHHWQGVAPAGPGTYYYY